MALLPVPLDWRSRVPSTPVVSCLILSAATEGSEPSGLPAGRRGRPGGTLRAGRVVGEWARRLLARGAHSSGPARVYLWASPPAPPLTCG